MNRNQRYLIALSNTQQDTHLIHYARLLAECHLGREFRFVHVTSTRAASRAVRPVLAGNDAADCLTRQVELEFGVPPEGVATTCHILAGERIDALLEFATRSRTDVILLGHRRSRSGQRSLARRLAMIAPSSVWLVPEGATASIRRVLAPVDFSEHSADALEVAADVARASAAERFLALHVHFDKSTVRFPEDVSAERAAEEDAFRGFLARVDTPGVNVETRIEEGPSPSKSILRVAEEESDDLIVMNTRGRSRAAAILLGSVTTQVMVESPVPVLAVKHFGAVMGLFQALKESHFWQQTLPKSN